MRLLTCLTGYVGIGVWLERDVFEAVVSDIRRCRESLNPNKEG